MDHVADDGVLVAEKDADPAVVTVTLNRPARKNAVSWPMWQRLLTTFRALALDPGVRVVVLTGAGGDFCSGADLASPAVTELVARISEGAPVAQLLTKRLLNEGLQSTLEQAVNHEAMAQVDNLGSADAGEARDAFIQRRPATFTGGWPGR